VGEDREIEALFNNGLVDTCYEVLKNDTFSSLMKRNVLWAMSNFTVGPENHIIKALPSEEHFKFIVGLCYSDDPKISEEATFVLCNTTNMSSHRRKH
jgi:hypothetical protein